MEPRIVELELKVTEQAELLQQLSDVLYAQQRQVDALEAQVKRLEQKLAGEPGLVDAAERERPPHY